MVAERKEEEKELNILVRSIFSSKGSDAYIGLEEAVGIVAQVSSLVAISIFANFGQTSPS